MVAGQVYGKGHREGQLVRQRVGQGVQVVLLDATVADALAAVPQALRLLQVERQLIVGAGRAEGL